VAHGEAAQTVRAATPDDAPVVAAIHLAAWGGNLAVGHGVAYDLATLPTLVAVAPSTAGAGSVSCAGSVVGVLTWTVDGDSLEVVSIDAVPPGHGTGTALLDAAIATARAANLRRVWLVTTNDNLDALRFYQRRGMRIVSVAPGAVDRSRLLKPAIPLVGAHGIPLRDELTLELLLAETNEV